LPNIILNQFHNFPYLIAIDPIQRVAYSRDVLKNKWNESQPQSATSAHRLSSTATFALHPVSQFIHPTPTIQGELIMAIRHLGAAALLGLSLLAGGIAATPASAHSRWFERDGYRYDRVGWYDSYGRYHRFEREGYRFNHDGWYDRHGRFYRFD
jgi:hypothetical protein